MKAVVMAGGEGTRLRPLTSNQPKPMVPIVGKPCIEHILELLRGHGFDEVVITLAFMPQAIRSYFGDGDSLNMNIEYSVEELPLGTAGSVRLASSLLDETFLVISGDALCDVDLGALVDRHKETGAAVTIGLKSVDNPLEFGIVVTDEDGKVERFLEKPSWGQVFSDTINTGIYVLEPEVLKHVPVDGPYDFSKELFPLLLEMGRPIYGHVMEGYWQDIGNLDQYRQANFDALDEKVRLNVEGVQLRGNVWIGEGTDIHDVEEIEGPAFIGNHCRIARDASIGPYTVLSNGVTLRERARTVRSVIDASTHVGRSALIEGAIIGRSCDIRDHVRIQEGAAIGDEVTIGSESSIMPHVRIYPYKEVESGSQLYENLIWETRASSRLFGKDGVTGLVNVDLTPETAARLATALGTALKRGARVVASRDSAPGCRMIKRAMISGLNAAGIDVADLRVSPPGVSRHVLKTQGFAAAVHVGSSHLDPEAVFIRIYEPGGILLTPGLQKEIEKNFTRQELRRVAAGGRRLGLVPGPRARELRAGPARLARRRVDPRAPVPDRRRLRLLGVLVRPAARRRPTRGRGDLGTRVLRRRARRPRDAGAGDRAHETARHRDRGGSRRRLRPVRRAPLPRRRAGPRGSRRPDAAAVRPAARRERDEGQGGVPDHGHEQDRRSRRRRARDHPDAELAQRADERGSSRRRRLRRSGRRRLRLPGVPAGLRRRREPREAARAPRADPEAALRARRGAAGADADPPPARLSVVEEGSRDARC